MVRSKIQPAEQEELNEIFKKHKHSWVKLGGYEICHKQHAPDGKALAERFDFLKELIDSTNGGEFLPNQGKTAVMKVVVVKDPCINETSFKNELYAGQRISRIVVMLAQQVRLLVRDEEKFEVLAGNFDGVELKKINELKPCRETLSAQASKDQWHLCYQKDFL